MVLSEQEVVTATQNDEILRKVYKSATSGWPPKRKEKELQPYEKYRMELSKYNGCLLMGNRIVVPKKFRKVVLKILHHSQFGGIE